MVSDTEIPYDSSKIKFISQPEATTPAIVGICLGATLFLVGIIGVTMFFYKRKSSSSSSRHRKGGVFLSNRSPISEHIPLQSPPVIITRRSEKSTHLMKKSSSPPPHFLTSKSISPVTPPTEEHSSSGNDDGRILAEVHKPFNRSSCYDGICIPINKSMDAPLPSLVLAPPSQLKTDTSPLHAVEMKHDSLDSAILNQKNGNTHSLHPETVGCTSTSTLSHNMEGGGQNRLGILHFKLRYQEEKGALIVTVVKCEDLPVKDTTHMTCDPYVKLQLLPEKQQRVKTRVLRHTRHPTYDEDFTFFGIQLNQLQGISLHFVVLSFDRYSRDDVIGEVFCPLSSIQLPQTDNHQLEISRDIQSRNLKMRSQGRGEVLLSLCWQPTANRFTVVVLKARNLPKMDVTGLADPYIKMYLLYDGQRIAKKKTHIKKKTLNPVFNESFIFDLPPGAGQTEASLEKVSLQLLLLDWDRVTKNEVIGRIDVGNGGITETATHHWNEVLSCPRRQIAEWHKLRD